MSHSNASPEGRPESPPGVVLRNLGKSYGAQPVFQGVDLVIPGGVLFTLVGPSGCGKSTVLRIIAGLEEQDEGRVEINGAPVDNLPPKDRNAAMVFQSFALYPHLTVFDNLAVPLRQREMSWGQRLPLLGRFWPGRRTAEAELGQTVLKTARALRLEELLERRPNQLSGGQKQRVALGRAMVRNPAVCLMDEPLSNLDAKLRTVLRREIVQLQRRLRATFIYVTHDQAEAMSMSDLVGVFMDGELVEVGPPSRIFRRPEDVRTARFIGTPRINLLPARLDGRGRLDLLDHTLKGPQGGPSGPVRVAVRPEAVLLAKKVDQGSFKGRLSHLEDHGADRFLHLAVAGLDEEVIIRVGAESGDGYELGQALGFDLDPARIMIFGPDGKRLEPAPKDREGGHG